MVSVRLDFQYRFQHVFVPITPTVSALADGAGAVGLGAHDEGVVVLLPVPDHPGPRVLLDVDGHLCHLGVRVEEVATEQQAERFGGLDLQIETDK